MERFKIAKVEHVHRTPNNKVDLLSKLATSKLKGHYHTIIYATLDQPTMTNAESNATEIVSQDDTNWMTPIILNA